MQGIACGRSRVLSRTANACRFNLESFRIAYQLQRGDRAYSSVVSPKASRVTVSVQSSGTIDLECVVTRNFPRVFIDLESDRIYPPSHPSPTNPIIIYLPRGNHLVQNDKSEDNDRATSSLVLGANATIVRIHYRHSPTYPYPTPIHDTFAGYDWVLSHLVRSVGPHNGWQSSNKAVGLGVCGELIGGSLAAALVLTECHMHRTGIRVAALGNPICDWTQMHSSKDERLDKPVRREEKALANRGKKSSIEDSFTVFATNPTLPASSLLAARTNLFTLAEKYFDPFASPLLFFRTASSDLPFDYLSPTSSPASSESEQETPMERIRKRRSHRRHPPMGSGLRIPKTRIDVGEECALRDQGWDLVDSMRRSVDLHEKERQFGAFADNGGVRGEQRVALRMRPGVGLWTDDDMVEVGRWMGEMLR